MIRTESKDDSLTVDISGRLYDLVDEASAAAAYVVRHMAQAMEPPGANTEQERRRVALAILTAMIEEDLFGSGEAKPEPEQKSGESPAAKLLRDLAQALGVKLPSAKQ